METIRQGDLLFIPTEKKEPNQEAHQPDGIVREGEATGHNHAVAVMETADVYRPSWGPPFVIVGALGATIVHPEHGPVRLAPDTTYEVQIAREFDYLSQFAVRVRD